MRLFSIMIIIIIITTAKYGNPRDPDDPPALSRGLYLFQQAKKCKHVNNEEKNKRRTTMAGQYAYIYKQYIKCCYYYYYCKNVNERFLRLYLSSYTYNDRRRKIISYLTMSV